MQGMILSGIYCDHYPQSPALIIFLTSFRTIQILNSILPPIVYSDEETGVQMVQRVSAQPASRDDVLALQVRLNQLLTDREARERGICPVREELYAQCFDELIRQVTIESPERGMLLLRVRDEARMTVAAYQTLYESSIAFGTRKTAQIEKGNAEYEQKIAELVKTKRMLQLQLQDQRGLYEAMEKRNAEIRLREQKKAQEELDFLTQQALQLESFINAHRAK